ncbi:hypothetical protein HRI_000925400 [Hibiscus trionum]|uniref:CCHC-type domain-containing protein n=1 Tax=Hibiscus trionum TaxID=183268 RepID=A0A9W7LQR3_HIBTR|nr:hypothetical protein HRI_000925400 [Hibiscus trionum]
MTEDVEVKVQINEYHKLLEDLKSENITLPEEFVTGLLIEKLPPSWNDYKQQLKHKHKQLSLKELITRIIIEKTNRKEVMNANKREFTTRANLIEGNARRGMSFKHNSRFRNHAMPKSNNSRNNVMPRNHAMPKFNNPTFKKKGNCCYVCGKPGHYAHQCRHRKGRHENPAQSNVNLVEADEIIVAVVSQANIVTNMTEWVIDSGATRHIRGNKNVFTSYTPIKEGEESVYLGDSRTTSVLGKGKVMLKLTSGKTLALSDVFYVPDIRINLVSVALLGKAGIKIFFESDKVILTKSNNFVGKGYCKNGLFVLNVSEIMNVNASSSSAYLIDSYDLWHARLGHLNVSYLKNMQFLGLISSTNNSLQKCETCAEAKQTKKSCAPTHRET